MARLKNPGKAQQTAPQPQTGPADATYTIVDVHNVSHSVIRQVEWLEQEIQAATNRVLQLEDEGDTDGEAPVQGAAAHEGNTDSQRQLIPVWLGDLRLTLSDDSQKLVYAIERVRIPQLHRKDIIGSRVSVTCKGTQKNMDCNRQNYTILTMRLATTYNISN